MLSRLAFLLTGSSTLADELAQDASEQVFRRWDDIKHRSYARLVVVNGSRSSGRRQRLAERTPGDARPDVHLNTDARAVRSVLTDLPRREREIVGLRYYADLTVADITAALDLALGTVKSHLHRAVRRMESELNEEVTS